MRSGPYASVITLFLHSERCVVLIYLRLRAAQWRTRWRSGPLHKALLIGKSLVLVRLIVASVQYKRAAPIVARLLGSDVLLPSAWAQHRIELFVAAAAIGAVLALLGVRIWAPLPYSPFWRFGSPRAWTVQSDLYPLLSATSLSLAVCAVVLFGGWGILYFFACYAAHLASLRAPRSGFLALTLLIAARAAAAPMVLLAAITGVLLVTAIAVPVIRCLPPHGGLSTSSGISNAAGGFRRNSTLSHEWAWLRRYSSDQAYLALGILGAVFSAHVFMRDALSGGPVVPQWWLLLCLPLLPFATILFNMLGTDTNVLPRYWRDPAQTASMQLRRLHVYRLAMYGANVPVLGLLIYGHASVMELVVYVLGAATFTELVMVVALPFSIQFVRRKDPAYRPGAQLLAGNQRFAFVVYLGLLAIIFGAYRLAGLFGLALMLCGTRGIQMLKLSSLATCLVERCRLEVTGAL